MNKLKKVPIFFALVPLLFVAIVTLYIALNNYLLHSFTDFFIVGARNPLSAIYAWTDINFGSSSTSIEIWRFFPFSFFFYAFNWLISPPFGLGLWLLASIFFVAGYISCVKLLIKILPHNTNSSWAAHLGALYFIFNPYTVTQFSNSFFNILPYLMLPAVLFLFVKGLETKQFVKYAVLIAIVNSLYFGVNLVFDVIAISLIGIYGLWRVYVEKQSTISDLLKIFIPMILISLLLSAYWLLPQLQSAFVDSETANFILSSETFYNIDSSPLQVLRGLGEWSFFSSNNGVPYKEFSEAYQNNLFVLAAGYLIPIAFLAPLVLEKRKFKLTYRKNILFFLILLILTLPIIGGTHPGWPTARLMQWAFDNIPFFMAFRNTYKFASIEVFALAMLLGLSAYALIAKAGNKPLKVLTVVGLTALIATNAFPFFNGQIFSNQNRINEIPGYWNEAAKFVNKLDKDTRILMLPNQYFEAFEWADGLKSFPRNLEATLFNKAIVFNTCKGCGSPNTSGLLDTVFNNLDNPSIYNLLGLTSVTSIIQRNDFAAKYYNVETPEEIKKYLSASPITKKIKSFGKLDYYEIDKSQVYSLFYSPTQLIESVKFDEFLDTIDSFDHSKGRLGYVLSKHIKGDRNLSDISSYYHRLFDAPETTVSNTPNGEVASNNVAITKPGSYSLQAGQNQAKPQSNYKLSYKSSGGKYVLFLENVGTKFYINNKQFAQTTDQNNVTEIQLGSFNSSIAIEVAEKAYLLNPEANQELGYVKLESVPSTVKIYSTETANRNLLSNNSFEDGLWQEKVKNCQQRSINADISMQLSNDATDGRNSLQLSASEDTACTFSPELDSFTPGLYLYSFDAKNIAGQAASYCVWDGKGCVEYRNLNSTKNWERYTNVSKLSADSSNFYLYLYSQRSNFKGTINRYDNISVQKLTNIIGEVAYDLPENIAKTTPVELQQGQHDISASIVTDTKNLVDNGSFESGLWAKKVSNCSGENDSSISMRANDDSQDGGKSLELSSVGDTACSASDSITAYDRDSSYLVGFNYKIASGSEARVCVWDGIKCLVDKKYDEKNRWVKIQEVVKPDSSSQFLSVYFYADAEKSESKVLYDNLSIATIRNNFLDTYTLTSVPTAKLSTILVKDYKKINATKYSLDIKQPEGNSVLTFNQSYHPNWKLKITPKSNNKQSFTISKENHFVINGFANGWVLNQSSLPSQLRDPDGEYMLELEYTTQRTVYIALAGSAITILGCILYLSYNHYRIKKSSHASKN